MIMEPKHLNLHWSFSRQHALQSHNSIYSSSSGKLLLSLLWIEDCGVVILIINCHALVTNQHTEQFSNIDVYITPVINDFVCLLLNVLLHCCSPIVCIGNCCWFVSNCYNFTISVLFIYFRLDPDEVVTGCFDFRTRTRSFDLHQLGRSSFKKKFTHLFHSSSDCSIKPISSAPATPPKGQSPQRRRLVRVVRDVEPDEYGEGNPHVIHKYSESFLKSKQSRQR